MTSMAATYEEAPTRAGLRTRTRRPSTGARQAAVLRFDIQGLRAVAVILVVVFHLWPSRLSGGYIGVDVFFVISGYLITDHLMRDLARRGRVSLSSFWAKRVRRLLPAAFVVLLASIGIAVTAAPVTLLKQNLQEIGAAALYALNWLLASNSVDYLAAENEPSIAQHYWSLSVEEQFYLVWPILILAAAAAARRFGRRDPRAVIRVLLVVLLVVSLASSVWFTHVSPSAAYFVTFTRVWEFAAGGLVAFLPVALFARLPIAAMNLLSWAALSAILIPAFVYDASTPFPGWTAVIPVGGTALLIALGDRESTWSPQFLARAGSVQFLGATSYSIYLWHWPLIVGVEGFLGRSMGWKWSLATLAATILLAWLTKRLVEDPLRSSSGWLRLRRRSFAFMAAGMALVLGLCVLLSFSTQRGADDLRTAPDDPAGCAGHHALQNDCASPYAVTDAVDPAFSAEDRYTTGPGWDDACMDRSARTGEPCEIGETGETAATVALFGDSHAMQFIEVLGEIAHERDWRVLLYARSECSGLETEAAMSTAKTGEEWRMTQCLEWGRTVRADLTSRDDVDLLLLTSRERMRAVSAGEAESRLAEFADSGLELAVISDIPGMSDLTLQAPSCVAAAIRRGETEDPCPQRLLSRPGTVTDAARAQEVPVIDLRSELADGDIVHTVIGGMIVYFDNNHLTRSFAKTLRPWLAGQIDALPAL